MPISENKLWFVGGHVRDELLGLTSKDIDLAVECNSFAEMEEHIKATHAKIFLSKPEFQTIRALTHSGEPRDYVMCRKDGAYSDGRHPDEVTPGTIYDDLARRDFTINAIAKNAAHGTIFDPFGGQSDLRSKTLRCVGSAAKRFHEDPLRILRAFRFMITKDLLPDHQIQRFLMLNRGEWLAKVSIERIREELEKCFKHDSFQTMHWLFSIHPSYAQHIFKRGIWFKPTLEKR